MFDFTEETRRELRSGVSEVLVGISKVAYILAHASGAIIPAPGGVSVPAPGPEAAPAANGNGADQTVDPAARKTLASMALEMHGKKWISDKKLDALKAEIRSPEFFQSRFDAIQAELQKIHATRSKVKPASQVAASQ